MILELSLLLATLFILFIVGGIFATIIKLLPLLIFLYILAVFISAVT